MDGSPRRLERLEGVLEDAEHPMARYHIRQALQYALFSEQGEFIKQPTDFESTK